VSHDDINGDELRREVRALGATAGRDAASAQRIYRRLLDTSPGVAETQHALLGRRDIFRIGGFTVATAAVISACGEHRRGLIGRVGEVPTTVPLPDVNVNNNTLLRTGSSLEHSIISVYSQVIGNPELLDPKYDDLFKRYVDDHQEHAVSFEGLTKAGGGTPWTCGNPKIDDTIINPVMQRITKGVPATSTAEAIPPSDDPRRDILNFAHGLESMLGASYQSFVVQFSDPKLRSDTMTVGAREGRHAALLAININPARPEGLVNFNDAVNAEPANPPTTTIAPTTTVQDIATPSGGSAGEPPPPQTEIPTVTAIPGQFGSLGAVQIVVGAGDVNGTRLKVNMETPSLNSFVYEFDKPTC
jgi:hypothetical protein